MILPRKHFPTNKLTFNMLQDFPKNALPANKA